MSEFVCQTWRVEDGLPQNSVMAIVQTRDGYIWLGTANGLARFDGVRFKRFGLAEGLSSLQVRVLLEDREGGLWVGTAKGLSRYRNGQFTSWTARDGLAGDMIMALAQDREGAIWIGTSTGSSRWHRGRFERIDATEEVANGYVRTLIADRNGVVWISLTKPGLTRWDGRKLVVVADWPKAFGVAPYQLMQDRAGRMWAGSVGRVTVGDGNSWKTYGPEAGVPRAKITSLAEDASVVCLK
jgi:ligand-binding sensor domain-containing protein